MPLKQVETVEAGPDPLNETSGSIVVSEVKDVRFIVDTVRFVGNSVKLISNEVNFSFCNNFNFFILLNHNYFAKHQVGADSAKVIGWSGGPVSELLQL